MRVRVGSLLRAQGMIIIRRGYWQTARVDIFANIYVEDEDHERNKHDDTSTRIE